MTRSGSAQPAVAGRLAIRDRPGDRDNPQRPGGPAGRGRPSSVPGRRAHRTGQQPRNSRRTPARIPLDAGGGPPAWLNVASESPATCSSARMWWAYGRVVKEAGRCRGLPLSGVPLPGHLQRRPGPPGPRAPHLEPQRRPRARPDRRRQPQGLDRQPASPTNTSIPGAASSAGPSASVRPIPHAAEDPAALGLRGADRVPRRGADGPERAGEAGGIRETLAATIGGLMLRTGRQVAIAEDTAVASHCSGRAAPTGTN